MPAIDPKRRYSTICLLIGFSLSFLTACASTEKPKNQDSKTGGIPSDYIRFPDGYGYMKNIKALQKATDKGDRAVIRKHAWKLWAGIMQPATGSDWPLWITWPNTQGAFQGGPGPVGAGKIKSTSKQASTVHKSIRMLNKENVPSVDTPAPTYPIPKEVNQAYPNAITDDGTSIKSGRYFLFNGDIMIPTESLSREAMANIRNEKLYLWSTLTGYFTHQGKDLEVTDRFIVTKHMYWPVKKDGVTGVPVWKNNFPVTFPGYAGYETWDTLVGIDPSGKKVGQTVSVEFLYGVKDNAGSKTLPTVKAKAKVFGLERFYFHQVTHADWKAFSEADKAIINAASYWANNQAFGPGDYLVTIAMHVNTKELPSWTLQSVWWSDTPDKGIYSENRPALPQAQGPWDHYLLTDAYAVPPNKKDELDVAVNPYIEGVIHPIGTSCRNCHVRAGWPSSIAAKKQYFKIHSSYQNKDCPELLSYLTPDSQCIKPLSLTDYLWIIPDRAQED